MSMWHTVRSRELMGSLNPEQINATRLGKRVYENDWFVRHALGEFMLGDRRMHVGLEFPKSGRSAQLLFLNNLLQIGYITERVPGFLQAVPSFVGAVATKAEAPSQAAAVLVEDLSHGGIYELKGRPASGELRAQLDVPSAAVMAGNPHDLITAEVEGEEKFVQLFPAPFGMDQEFYDLAMDGIRQAQEGLTVVLNENSRLSQDLIQLGQTVG